MRRSRERWYAEACDDRAAALTDELKAVRRRSRTRAWRSYEHACLYGAGAVEELSGVISEYGPSSLQFNVIRRNVSTAHARVAKSRPAPMALTSGGYFRQRRRAAKLTRFFSGSFRELDVYATSELVARDALIFGTGISHTYRDGERLAHERVLIWELDVDPGDARYGRPRVLYRHQWRDRVELAEEYPEHASALREARCNGFEDDPLRDREGTHADDDQTVVIEAWRLPSKPGAEDGRYLKVCGTVVLDDAEYTRDVAPFCVLHFERPLVGYWGDGFAHILDGIQRELNRVAAKVQDSQYMMGTYWLVDEGANFNVEHLDNCPATVLRYGGGGAPPQPLAPNANAPQTLQYLEQLRSGWARDEVGVSEMAQTSSTPSGVTSGTALRTLNQLDDGRLALFMRQYERYHVEIGWLVYHLTSEIAKEGGTVRVRAVHRRRLEEIEWKDVEADRESLVLEVFPTSALSQEPAQRRAEVAEWINSGFIPPDVGRQLLDFPDLEDFAATEDAPRHIVEDVIWRMLESEDPEAPESYIPPEPTWDLKLCSRLGSLLRARAWLDGADPANLDLVLRFATAAESMIASASSPPEPSPGAPPPSPAPPDPGAMPPPPPVLQ